MISHQRGIALISVLLVMSLALLITGGLLRSHRLLLQSSGQQLQQIHLRQLAEGGEIRGLLLLQEVAQTPQKTVDLTQDWAGSALGVDRDDAQISVDIEDLAGRFNLNALLHQGQVDQLTRQRWVRLLALLDLPAMPLSQVGSLRELSQLRLLPGIDAQWLSKLEPWVALLPTDAALNINTASAHVLRTLEGVQAATVDALLRQRSTQAWASVQAFTQDPLLSGAGLSSHGLGVDSRWYRITVQVNQGQGSLRLVTDVELDPDTRRLNILQRRFLPSHANETRR
ncbi:general secretion pathway protein GspK [Pseudomonas frederiksbergensis]|uniref:general secretion pathway protein GspK n=1 Tax=Pseudomonas frederiksbergensis TaxID=104087 RepID=UPI000F465743|nr:type II secretion system protein GspK [Pseudomonas frederiksbergensis]